VLFLFSGVCWGAFGDIIEYFQLPSTWKQPISIAYGDSALWILNFAAGHNSIYEYRVSITDGVNLEILHTFGISDYASNDLNGLAYAVEESGMKFLWTTSCIHNQLWQLDLNTEQEMLPLYRTIQLPVGYYPTGITLDNNLNIYFIDGIKRKICKIAYSDYVGIPPHGSGTVSTIIEGNPLPAAPSIPMGIEYINEIPPKFYLTFAGENDYLMKTTINGIEITRKDLHQTQNPEFKSLMPTDLAVDSNGQIWFTDCDYDRLFKAYAQ
jgi:hypothetical protein